MEPAARLVIICPMNVELRPVAAALGLRAENGDRHRFGGVIGSSEVVALLGGVGPDAAQRSTRRVLDEMHPTHLVVAGVAGGLGPDVRVGDLVVPEEAALHGTTTTTSATPLGDVAMSGRIITTDTILSDAELAADIADGFVAVDMETAVIGSLCDDAGVPWTAFRGISDRVGDGVLDQSALDLVNNDGTTNLGAVARRAIGHPQALRQMARLRRDGKSATAAVGVALATALRRVASG